MPGVISKKKSYEVADHVAVNGVKTTADVYGLSQSTIKRYVRYAKKRGWTEKEVELCPTLRKIQEQYTPKELKAIAKGGRVLPGQQKTPIIDFTGDRVRIGAFGDPHIGSVNFNPAYFEQMLAEFKKEKVDIVTCTGDVTEGMSHRAGHIYELTHLGANNQKRFAIEMLGKWKGPAYCIDGNHDRWYVKSNGLIIVQDICEHLDNWEFLGHDEGNISLKGQAVLKLFHGEDSSSYALSYRVQKIIESFTGGEKPQAFFCGHTHKAIYVFDRHVHCYSMGAMSKQSQWMRSKRLANHYGFWIVDLWINDSGICKSRGTWYPFYT